MINSITYYYYVSRNHKYLFFANNVFLYFVIEYVPKVVHKTKQNIKKDVKFWSFDIRRQINKIYIFFIVKNSNKKKTLCLMLNLLEAMRFI